MMNLLLYLHILTVVVLLYLHVTLRNVTSLDRY